MTASNPSLRLATFVTDVTPPLGAPLCHGYVKPAERIVDRLTARGIILLGAGAPIVICVYDWLGISNTAHDLCRAEIARAVGTSLDRVTVHVMHPHDAPGVDFATVEILEPVWSGWKMFDAPSTRALFAAVGRAAGAAMNRAVPVTHLGVGQGIVEKVASNRRVQGPDGKVIMVRLSSCKDPAGWAAPEGTVDPVLRLLSFWHGDRPVAALSHYATHPQSHYGQGGVSYDFPGMARAAREQALPGVALLHFNGCGGNVAAGKYNDGSPEMRPILAARMEAGMKAAWEHQQMTPITAADIGWEVEPVSLPVRDTITEQAKLAELHDTAVQSRERMFAARDLAFLRRMKSGHRIPINCLRVGPARVLYLPAEMFVEYQLAAAKMRPDLTVCVAAYGDLGPGYVGTKIAYAEGGYEVGFVSRVAPDVEDVIMAAMRALLQRD